MSWETRRGKRYYYHRRREGGRVVAHYYGNSQTASLVSDLEETCRAKEQRGRVKERMKIRAMREDDAEFERACELVDALTEAVLLLNGFHTHRGEWRKRREADA